ncbi:unnamed protein product [Prorocentrum cordatum]|uniref:Uncharacterized protein n=1 Tax=Prorocentrum cordatum TaxID=2364126 RepID=A0ABN9QKX9_9DINO|nr:unnamed protein product [Polarella glacialis]|mmetsp:Transcript_80194/g.217195  ORF Transcript_80194/g.217195 Transcript_80194/m.217195 type:complete len:178 (-) Transcript_80194:41-574(-)
MALHATSAFLGCTAVTAASAVLCTLVMAWWALVLLWWALVVRRWPLSCAQGHVEAGPTDLDLGIDFEAFLAQMGHCCDAELDALCESAMDSQSARVLQDLEGELGGGPVGSHAGCQPTHTEPALALETLQAKLELHRGMAKGELRSNGAAQDRRPQHLRPLLWTANGETRRSSTDFK